MTINWGFQEVEREFEELPQGTYRCRIAAAEEKITKTGKPMASLTLDISGHYQKLFYNLVFDSSNPTITNQKLQSIYDSFDIPAGNTDVNSWKGKVGALKTKIGQDQYGAQRTEIHYFISKSKSGSLPAWQEPSSNSQDNLPSLDGDDIQF